MPNLLAAAPFGANLLLGLFLLLMFAGLVIGWFTFMGSGISNHPVEGTHAPPGARLPDEFHMFEERQFHEAELREAEIERRVDARMARWEAEGEPPPRHGIHLHLPHRAQPDDMSIDEVNRRLAAEAAARKQAATGDREHAETL
jgi:hypothetical protein